MESGKAKCDEDDDDDADDVDVIEAGREEFSETALSGGGVKRSRP